MKRLARSIAALTAISFTLAATPVHAAEGERSATGPAPEATTSQELTLEAPTLQFADKGAGMDGKKMMSLGVLLAATGAASAIGASFFVMSCPESSPRTPVNGTEIKCFDAPTTETDPNKPVGQNTVDVPGGPGYETLPIMLTLASMGGVLLISGITMIALGMKKKKASGLAAGPSFNRGGAGLVLTGRF